jgi:hypothetical protein
MLKAKEDGEGDAPFDEGISKLSCSLRSAEEMH